MKKTGAVRKQLFGGLDESSLEINPQTCVQQVMHIAKGFNLDEEAAIQLARLVQIKLS